ncbi:hypothetical protein CO641_07775 [Lysobacteraceae bacterium NML91-0213]|nr:hypothetical protein CO641_07775 [Xanthomonadaceae bacterium NML91-0213]
MSYHTGSVAAVPTANRQQYLEHARQCWPLFQRHGATRMVETWGEDVPHGKLTDFHRAVDAKDDESVTFSWITWPDRASADAAWQAMSADPAMRDMQMPFDGSRMFWGGFETVYGQGDTVGGAFYQGFVLAVPAEQKAAYVDMAAKGWEMARRTGALGVVEAWGEDVPHGKRTDFYRATRARDDEVIVFSWINWADRAACDAAARAMEQEAGDMSQWEMPFDGSRMFRGGFATLFDSASPSR